MKAKSTFLILTFSGLVFSQEKINTTVLERISSEYNLRYQKELGEFNLKFNSEKNIHQDETKVFAGFSLGAPVFYQNSDSRQATATNTDLLYNNSIPGVQVNGNGMNVFMWDGGNVRATHNELTGRVTNKESVALSDHSTSVAGVLIGAGGYNSAGVNSKGMAYESTVNTYSYNNNFAEISAESANPENAEYLISNHSYGVAVGWAYNANEGKWYWYGNQYYYSGTEGYNFGYYGQPDQDFDRIAYNAPQHVIVKSVGNDNHEGPNGTLAEHWSYNASWGWEKFENVYRPKDCEATGFDCIQTSSLGKNIITVGSVQPLANGRYSQASDVVIASTSSFGPADDGRIKPDVVAVGENVLMPTAVSDNSYGLNSGTSFSTPAVTGNILLLQQLFEQQYGTYMRSDLAKALVVHTANEAGTSPGPDYKFGWGLMDAAKAAEVIMGKDATAILDTHTLHNGETFNFSVRGIENTPLKVTIVWLDPEANIGAGHNDRTPTLINDLDLRINDGLVEYFPWKLDVYNPAAAATRGDNLVDNVEQILIDHPVEGLNYEISVSHKGNLQNNSQVFAIIVSGATFCPATTIWDGSNWSNGLPDSNSKAVINGSLVLNENLEACELELTSNGNLEIPSGFNFTVNGGIVNKTTAENFVVESGANLIQNKNIKNTGEITVIRDSNPMRRLDYTIWSSPVAAQNLFGFSPLTVNGVTNHVGSTGRIYIYDGDNGYVNPSPFTTDAVMNQGVGYLYRSPNDYDPINETVYNGKFKGIPNNGSISVATVAGNYTSVGNPYPSNISMTDFLSANPDINTLYFWNNNHSAGNNYAACTNGLGCVAAVGGGNQPNGFISVGQGLIVDTDAVSVNFDNSMRVNNTALFFRVEEDEISKFRLNLNNEAGIGYNQILIGYTNESTNAIDKAIDAQIFDYEGSKLSSLINETKLAIQGRALPFETSDVVPLGFKAAESGNFVIAIADYEGLFANGQKIYLNDKELNFRHDLTESDYVFNSEAGEFNERFEIVYKIGETMGNEELESNSIQIYTKNQNITIESKSDKILSVELYDLSGRNLFRKEKVNSHHYEFQSLSKGVLVVKVQTQNGEVENRKIVLN